MEIHCNHCAWIGQEPNPAEFETEEGYEEAYAEFRDSHDNAFRNICPAFPLC